MSEIALIIFRGIICDPAAMPEYVRFSIAHRKWGQPLKSEKTYI